MRRVWGRVEDVLAVGSLNGRSGHFFLLPSESAGDGLIRNLRGIVGHELLLHSCFHAIHGIRISQHLCSEGQEKVQTVDLIARDHGKVHCDQLKGVRFRYPQGVFQRVAEFGQPTVSDELRGGGVELLPGFVEHLKVILAQGVAAFFRRYVEVFQDNGYVHVDHDEEGHDNVAAEEDDAYRRAPAVSSDRRARVHHIWVAVWCAVEYRCQQSIPAGGGCDHEQAYDTVPEGLEIKHVIDASFFFHIPKVGHAKYGENKHD